MNEEKGDWVGGMKTPRSTPDWGPLIAGFFCAPLVFWTPSIMAHALSPDFGTLGEPLYLTAVLPVLVFMVLVAPRWPRRVTLSALLGIWMLGPLFMMVSAT